MKTRHLATAVFAVVLQPWSAAAQRSGWCDRPSSTVTVAFDGSLSGGERFQRAINAALFFTLEPVDAGWTVRVGGKDRNDANFADVAALPLRQNYGLEIRGWHFGTVAGAPGRERSFEFVLNPRDYERVEAERTVLLWPYTFSAQEVERAQAFSARVTCGAGTLIIRDPVLQDSGAPDPALARFSFHVSLVLPK